MPPPDPQQIGKYRILERVGRGGMGTVYKAHDPVLDRLVALKVISSEREATDELRARFYREAQACAKLSHPNIVVVHDLGEADEQLFIVMEFLDGEDLKRIIGERRALSLDEKVDWMAQICDGLRYAHEKGIIHRDVKPGNIFVLRSGQVKILDFGIARIAAGSDPGLTRTGLIMGTLRYMSPEQARGRVDQRSDIFSVGTVFYELLSYRPAFDSEDPVEILEKVRSEEPAPLTQLDPGIPPELAGLVERALQKDPAHRFSDLAELRTRLEAVRRGLTDEGERLAGHVRARVTEIRALEAALATHLGQPAEEETLRIAIDRGQLEELRALARGLAERLERLRARVRQAEALEPALARGAELLRAGTPETAIAELERVLQEMPEHARAARELREARAAAARRSAPAAVGAAPAPLTAATEGAPVVARSATRPSLATPPTAGWRRVMPAVLGLIGLLAIGAYALYPAAFRLPSPAPDSAPVTASRPATPSIPAAPLGSGGEATEALRKEVEARRVQERATEVRRAAELVAAARNVPALWARAIGLDRDAESALRQGEFDRAQTLWRDAEQAYRVAESEAAQKAGGAERERAAALKRELQAAEQVAAAAAAARREAEQAGATRQAAKPFAMARDREAEGQTALERHEYATAQLRLGEAQAEYQRATQEAQKAAEAERQRVAATTRQADDATRLKQEVERLRASVVSTREQALRIGADRQAKELFDGGRAKESEAGALEGEQNFAAASQAYQDAAQRYGEALSRAQVARVAKVEADQARARMQADKQKARADSADYRAGIAEEQQGDAKYEGAAFKEAAGYFRAAQGLFARAATSASDAPPAGGDMRAEIRAVLDAYKQAIEGRDLAMLRKVRPGIAAAEVRRSFEQSKNHKVEFTIQSIDVRGNEAEAKGRRLDVVVSKEGQTFRNEAAFVFKLRRGSSGWVIETAE